MSEGDKGPRPFIFVLLDVFDAMPVHAMPKAERAVMIAIAAHAHPDGTGAFPSFARMSRRIGYGASAIVEAVRNLSRRRWLTVAERRDPETGAVTSNGYTVRLDGEPWGEDEAVKRKRRPPIRRAEPVPDSHRPAEGPPPPGGTPPIQTAEGPFPRDGGPLSAGRQVTANEQPRIPQGDQPMNTQIAHAREGSKAQVRETVRAADDRQEGGAAIGAERPALADLCVPPASKTADKAPPAGVTPALPGLEGVVDPAPAPAAPKPDEVVWAAYLEGRARAGVKGGAPVLDAKRKAVVAARLKDGFTVEDLARAARGIWRSDWHTENGHTSFELALRNASQIERFRELGRPPKPVDPEFERMRYVPPWSPPKLSPEEQQRVLDQYFPGVYTKKAAANG